MLLRKGNAERRPIEEAGPSQAGKQARILIADDDLGTRELLTAFTQDLGYAAVAVSDGKAALAAAATFLMGHTVSIRELEQLTGLDLLPNLDADALRRAVASELWPRN